jgi:hypothetical protein
MFGCKERVSHGHADGFVASQFLHSAHVRASHNQPQDVGVPQQVNDPVLAEHGRVLSPLKRLTETPLGVESVAATSSLAGQ